MLQGKPKVPSPRGMPGTTQQESESVREHLLGQCGSGMVRSGKQASSETSDETTVVIKEQVFVLFVCFLSYNRLFQFAFCKENYAVEKFENQHLESFPLVDNSAIKSGVSPERLICILKLGSRIGR